MSRTARSSSAASTPCPSASTEAVESSKITKTRRREESRGGRMCLGYARHVRSSAIDQIGLLHKSNRLRQIAMIGSQRNFVHSSPSVLVAANPSGKGSDVAQGKCPKRRRSAREPPGGDHHRPDQGGRGLLATGAFARLRSWPNAAQGSTPSPPERGPCCRRPQQAGPRRRPFGF